MNKTAQMKHYDDEAVNALVALVILRIGVSFDHKDVADEITLLLDSMNDAVTNRMSDILKEAAQSEPEPSAVSTSRPSTYDDWIKEVEQIMLKIWGMGIDDMPDFDYMAYYYDDLTPQECIDAYKDYHTDLFGK
jgi:hypothetical protein